MTNKSYYFQLQRYAELVVNKASKMLKSYEQTFAIEVQKDIVDIATTADIETEKFIIASIHNKYPDHGVDGEESGLSINSSPFIWVIDPLDMTKEYVRGTGEYNCLIGVEENNSLVVGVTKIVGTNVMYSCSKGNGAYRNKKPITVSITNDLKKSFIGIHIPKYSNSKEVIKKGIHLLESLIPRTYRVRPGWDTAKAFAWTSQGVLEAHIVTPECIKWCDVASTIPLIEEAGGMITDWNGNSVNRDNYTNGLIASNGKIHDQLLGIIQKIV